MVERVLSGQPASTGLAAGPLMRLTPAPTPMRERVKHAKIEHEVQALREALSRAAHQLHTLTEHADTAASDVIGFQLALIEDETLTQPIYEAVRCGQAADTAWAGALDDEIEHYAASSNEYFRARASDLRDLRDRVLDALFGDDAAPMVRHGAVVVADDLSPSAFLAIDWSSARAIVLMRGSASSHVAMLARAKGVPMIVGLAGPIPEHASEVLVDAVSGTLHVEPTEDDRRRFAARMEGEAARRTAATRRIREAAVTRDGVRVAVRINVASLAELDRFDAAACDGIGLVRTELLFGEHFADADENTQYHAYRRLLDWCAGKPVVVRTLDAGADKPMAGITLEHESNPFLGMRGVRLSLARPDLFRVQLRALARAAAHGDLKVMIPMVTTPRELEAVRVMLAEEIRQLERAGIDARMPPLGMMVEVPAAALAPESFDADFHSIGSNDLTQYVTATGRDNAAVASLADPLNPAVLRLIAHVAHHGAARGLEVSLCGDAAADTAVLPHLLACGLRALSVGIASVARVKAAIADLDVHASMSALPVDVALFSSNHDRRIK